MIIASLCVIFIIFLIFLAGYFYFFAKLLFVRVCFAYSHSQKYILELKRNIFHWDLHKALLRFIIVVSLGIVAYIVIAGCSMSLVLLGQSGDTLDVLSTFLAFTGVLILTGFWYSFAANMMRYSKRRIWTIYIVYITLVFMSFLIPALGLSEIALINIIVNGNSFILRIGEIPFIIVFS